MENGSAVLHPGDWNPRNRHVLWSHHTDKQGKMAQTPAIAVCLSPHSATRNRPKDGTTSQMWPHQLPATDEADTFSNDCCLTLELACSKCLDSLLCDQLLSEEVSPIILTLAAPTLRTSRRSFIFPLTASNSFARALTAKSAPSVPSPRRLDRSSSKPSPSFTVRSYSTMPPKASPKKKSGPSSAPADGPRVVRTARKLC